MTADPHFAVYGSPSPLEFADGTTGWRSAVSVGQGQAVVTVVHHCGPAAAAPGYRSPRVRLAVDGEQVARSSSAGGAAGGTSVTTTVFEVPGPAPAALDIEVAAPGRETTAPAETLRRR